MASPTIELRRQVSAYENAGGHEIKSGGTVFTFPSSRFFSQVEPDAPYRQMMKG